MMTAIKKRKPAKRFYDLTYRDDSGKTVRETVTAKNMDEAKWLYPGFLSISVSSRSKKNPDLFKAPTVAELEKLSVAMMNEFQKRGKVNQDIIMKILKPWAASFGKRRRNPVPPARRKQLEQAMTLYENFSGHPGEVVTTIEKPEYPDVALAIGTVDGLLYTTTRDGKRERYIHEFKKTSRPLFASSYDGKNLYMLGGAYDFTERGIVDRTGRRK